MTRPDEQDPESLSILFDLFAAGQASRALLVAALATSPLKPDEYAVYSVLNEPGTHTPTAVRSRLGMPAPTLSDYLSAMAERGHLARKSNPDDGRSSVLTLTRAGRAAHARTARDFEPAIRALLQELVSDPSDLRAGLNELREAALRAAEATRDGSARLP